MSARNMVRNLRDSGALATQPQGSNWRSAIVLSMAAVACGAVLYLGAVHGLPGLMQAMEKQPPPISFARP